LKERCAKVVQFDPGISAILERWSALPVPTRRRILKLAGVHGGCKVNDRITILYVRQAKLTASAHNVTPLNKDCRDDNPFSPDNRPPDHR
jgi:hypothetical protein